MRSDNVNLIARRRMNSGGVLFPDRQASGREPPPRHDDAINLYPNHVVSGVRLVRLPVTTTLSATNTETGGITLRWNVARCMACAKEKHISRDARRLVNVNLIRNVFEMDFHIRRRPSDTYRRGSPPILSPACRSLSLVWMISLRRCRSQLRGAAVFSAGWD